MNYLLLTPLMLVLACDSNHHREFNKIKPILSSHFDYTVTQSEINFEQDCRKLVMAIEGRAKRDLKLRHPKNVIINTAFNPPSVLDLGGLSRFIQKRREELKMNGVRGQCLEERDFECTKFHFRHSTEQDLIKLTDQIEKEYAIGLKQGETLHDTIQLKLCPHQETEVSYLVQVP